MTTSLDRTWWRRLSGWRHQASALLVTALGPLALLALTAAPAHAAPTATAPFAAPHPTPAVTAVRLFVVGAGVVVAGTGLCRVLVPISAVTKATRRALWAAASVAAVAAAVAGLLGQASPPLAAVQVILTLAVVAGLASVPVVAPVALGLLVLVAVELSGTSTGLAAAFEVTYACGAALLGGSSMLAATGAAQDTDSRIGRAAAVGVNRVAVGAGVLATGAGAAQLVVSGPYTTIDMFRTDAGLATLAALVLPLAATATWLLASRSVTSETAVARTRPAGAGVSVPVAGRIAVVGVVIAVAAFSVLALLPPPAAAPQAGRPLLRPVNLSGHELSLLVSPALPGPNLVRLSGVPATPTTMPATAPMAGMAGMAAPPDPAIPAALSISAGGRAVTVTVRPGASGGWAVLDIPAGTGRLTVSQAGASAAVPVDVGSQTGTAEQQAMQAALTGPDGPECADAVIGGLLADNTAALPTTCPSQRLDPGDGESLRVVVNSLADRGIRSLALAQDSSPRSAAAAAVVRSQAARRQVTVSDVPDADGAVIVVSGWAAAVDALHEVTRRSATAPTAVGGTYLAPWLLTGNVINNISSSVLALRYNPEEVGPRQYAATLASVFPDSVPSDAGYTAWQRATRAVADHRVTLYGAAPVNVPMGGAMDMEMGGGPGEWYPGGSIVPISQALTGS